MEYHITKSELEILNVLWKAGVPLSRADILEQSKDKTWKDNSIHILLNGMLKDGIIHEAGFARSGKVWGRLYAPAITVEDYYADRFKSGIAPDPVKLVQKLLDDNPDLSIIRRIEEILAAAKERAQK